MVVVSHKLISGSRTHRPFCTGLTAPYVQRSLQPFVTLGLRFGPSQKKLTEIMKYCEGDVERSTLGIKRSYRIRCSAVSDKTAAGCRVSAAKSRATTGQVA